MLKQERKHAMESHIYKKFLSKVFFNEMPQSQVVETTYCGTCNRFSNADSGVASVRIVVNHIKD
jgi:hypothetical protein